MARRRPSTPPKIPNATYLSYLGSGGFADVYLYEQQIPHREVAIKVLKRGVADAQKAAFRAEANLMARMSAHPSILSVYGAGETEDGRMYLVMEYCPPPHMGMRLRQRVFTVPQVLELGIQLAGAIETLHRVGIVHRDIKPSNILVTSFQRPVLTDFGIATQIGDEHPAEGFSVPWAPPEQATGEDVASVTIDVYSLAATTYTLLAGHAPFEAVGGDNSEIAVINRVLRSPVPPTGRSDVPEELERVLTTAMAKDPGQRYASVIEFARALQAVQVLLHQRPTGLDVESEPSSIGHEPSDDEDATRQTIRKIKPLQDESTRDAPKRLDAQDPGGARRSASVWSDGSRSPKGKHSMAEPEVDDDPTVTTRAIREPHMPPPPAGMSAAAVRPPASGAARRRPGSASPAALAVRFLLAAVVVIGLIWAIVFAVQHGRGGTIRPTSRESASPVDPGASDIKPVTDLRGEVKGDQVTFTWKNPDPQPGDKYLYSFRFLTGEGEVLETDKLSVTLDKQSHQTCLVVRVHRQGGKESEPVEECVASP
ncbi:MAG: protein kinase [Actinomycetaceae bacterium]|nr:protein kinase [Actinomycetaceae bacterium]